MAPAEKESPYDELGFLMAEIMLHEMSRQVVERIVMSAATRLGKHELYRRMDQLILTPQPPFSFQDYILLCIMREIGADRFATLIDLAPPDIFPSPHRYPIISISRPVS